MTQSTGDAAYDRARSRVKSVQAFYYGLGTYVVINIALFLINLFTLGDDGGWWFYWVTVPWGIGMLFWGFSTFAGGSGRARDWEDRKMQKYLEQERRHDEPGGAGDDQPPQNPIS